MTSHAEQLRTTLVRAIGRADTIRQRFEPGTTSRFHYDARYENLLRDYNNLFPPEKEAQYIPPLPNQFSLILARRWPTDAR